MGEQLSGMLASLQFWSNLSLQAKRMIIAVLVAIVLVALVLSLVLHKDVEYVPIFSDLSESEQTEVWAHLQEIGVVPKTDASGRIMVPAKDAASVRMQLATAGYPKNGLSYYLFEENSGLLTTDYARRQTDTMMLQERIAASIKTLEGVRSAVVTITRPSENVFAIRDEVPPTASVIIHMQPGSSLSAKQITGIQNLVSKSVTGLLPENIALNDGQGNDLLGTAGVVSDTTGMGVQRQYESDIRQKILSVLTGPYRPEEIRVAVSAVVNTDVSVVQEETFIPSADGDNSGVIKEERDASESYQSTTGDGGVPGTETNSQVPTYPSGGLGGETQSSGGSSETLYDVSSRKTQTMQQNPQIQSISIGVAIDKDSFLPGEEARITNLVAAAANTAPENVTVMNFTFYSDAEPEIPGVEPTAWQRYMMLIIVGAVVLLAIITLVILLLLRRRKKAAELAAAEAAELAAAAAAEQMIEYDEEGLPIAPSPDMEIGPIAPMRDKRREEIQEFAKSNPEITAQMIKTLLKTEEG
ncbi:MAG: flagellar M-ring protein FliF [Clostridiales Family XIII bacterium]|jgi:flagellar M-ring protein FliF|nr:flagellar M-ring protein FliF [Clostridiales Family XIII bacterium]